MLAKQKPLLKPWRKALVRNESRLCPRCASLGFSELLEVPTASESAQFFQDQHGSPQGIVLDIYLAPRKQSINLGKSASWATEYCATCVMFNEAKYHNAESETRQDWDGAFEYSLFVFDSYTTTGLDVNVIEAGFAVCSAPPKPIEYANLPLIVPQLHARQTKDKLFRSVKENVDTSLVRNWISICQKSHPQAECSLSRDSRTVPKYLIDCTSRRIVREVAVANYVALSYVWGRPPDNDTMPKFDFVTARLPDRLPKTIDDAITLTKSLGYNYLWADKYCINQDDPVEKAHELACMHRIYADSVLTIVDLAGGNDRDGLAGLSQQRRPSKKASIKDLDLIILPPEPRSQVWTSTWATRGWTYQEGIFARRKVFLGAQETSFVCASMQIRETWGFPETVKDMSRFELRPDKLANSTFGSPRPMLTPEARYWQNVLEYCTKKLSFDEDALNAFRGLLTMYCQDPANFYQVYGMTIMRPDTLDPFRCLARSLMWIPIPLDGPQGRRERRPDFPSWSWLGWKDSIITRFCSPSRNDTFQNLVDHAMVGVNSFNHDGSSAVVYDTFIDGDDTLPRNLNFWTLSQSPRLTHLLALDAPIVTVSLSTSSISPVFMDDFHDHIFLTITSRDGTRTTYPAMLTNVSHYFESEETLAAVMGYHDFDASEYWEGLADSYSLQQWAGNCRAVYLMYLSDYGDESVGHAGATVLAMRNQHFEKFKRSLHPRRFLLR